MSDFNNLPLEASPALADSVFTARGTLGSMPVGAERAPNWSSVFNLGKSLGGLAASFPSDSITQIVYVNKGGDNATATGNINQPYLTIGAALVAITDASSSKTYVIIVGPGTYTENVAIKAFCFLRGSNPLGNFGITIINGDISLATDWGIVGPNGGIDSITANTMRGTASLPIVPIGCSSATLILRDVSFETLIEWRDSNSTLYLQNLNFPGDCILTNGSLFSYNSFLGSLSLDTNGFDSFANIYGGLITNVDFEANGNALSVTVLESSIEGDATFDSTSGLSLLMDSGSYPRGVITLNAGAVILRATESVSVKYTPDNSGNWPVTVPGLVSDALDLLAARPTDGNIFTQEIIAGFSSAGNSDVTRPSGSLSHTALITASAGAGDYTRTITLLTTGSPTAANLILCSAILPASNNPTLQFWSGDLSGSPIATIVNDAAAADTVLLTFEYVGAAWVLISSTYTSTRSLPGTATVPASDDYVAVDGETNGIRRILGSKFSASVQTAEFISGFIATVADKSYVIVINIPHAGTITAVTTQSESGTCTLTGKINSTALGGTANSVSTSEQTQAQASANVFSAGDNIVITISSNSACLGVSFMIQYTRAYSS